MGPFFRLSFTFVRVLLLRDVYKSLGKVISRLLLIKEANPRRRLSWSTWHGDGE
jgi:hypothetical protein